MGDRARDSEMGGTFPLQDFPPSVPRFFCDFVEYEMFKPVRMLIENVEKGFPSNSDMRPYWKLRLTVFSKHKPVHAARIYREIFGKKCLETGGVNRGTRPDDAASRAALIASIPCR